MNMEKKGNCFDRTHVHRSLERVIMTRPIGSGVAQALNPPR